MTNIRPPAVAGMFYPDEAGALRAQVRDFIAHAISSGPRAKALIVPHAGYIYSGSVAASAYARIQAYAAEIARVILLGPAHRVPLRGIATPSAEFFATPLGGIAVDQAALERIRHFPFVHAFDEAHALEHSLEVQFPFLQDVLRDFSLVPLVVGATRPQDVAQVLETLWGGDETLIVISSDLSHHHDYRTARQMDSSTSQAIEPRNGS